MRKEEAVQEVMRAIESLCAAQMNEALSLYPPPDIQAALQATIVDRQKKVVARIEQLVAGKSAAQPEG